MSAEVVNVHAAKTHLSRLLERVEAGEEVVIARAGRPVARLVRFTPDRPHRVPGALRGRIRMLPGFDDLDADIAREFDDAVADGRS